MGLGIKRKTEEKGRKDLQIKKKKRGWNYDIAIGERILLSFVLFDRSYPKSEFLRTFLVHFKRKATSDPCRVEELFFLIDTCSTRRTTEGWRVRIISLMPAVGQLPSVSWSLGHLSADILALSNFSFSSAFVCFPWKCYYLLVWDPPV